MARVTIPARVLGQIKMPDFCERCYWVQLHYGKAEFPFHIPMPGIFGSLDAYGKNLIHTYFDAHGTLPPWFPSVGQPQGYLSGSDLHHSKFYLDDPATNIHLTGTPDDVFRLADGSYHVVDYKTTKITKTQDKLLPLYEVQLNVYAYIARLRGYTPMSAISLIYMEPQTAVSPANVGALMTNADYRMDFKAARKPVTVQGDVFVLDLLKEARRIYDLASPPPCPGGCENCQRLDDLVAVAGTP